MSLFLTVFATVLAQGAVPMGSIYGKVVAKASHYVTQPKEANGYARRQAAPANLVREPMGVVVALEGEALNTEKFDPPTDEVKIEAKGMGIEPRLIGCMVGSPLSIANSSDKPLKLSGLISLKAPIAANDTKKILLDEVGVFEITDNDRPDMKLTLVVTKTPFVIALDETGEFLFEDLTPGAYALKVYSRGPVQKVPVVVKAQEREQVTIALKHEQTKNETKTEKGSKKANP
jgi:hypothetical protein